MTNFWFIILKIKKILNCKIKEILTIIVSLSTCHKKYFVSLEHIIFYRVFPGCLLASCIAFSWPAGRPAGIGISAWHRHRHRHIGMHRHFISRISTAGYRLYAICYMAYGYIECGIMKLYIYSSWARV